MSPDPVVCECLKVTREQLLACVGVCPALSLREIAGRTGAGSGCTACRPAVEAILRMEAARRAYGVSDPSCSAR